MSFPYAIRSLDEPKHKSLQIIKKYQYRKKIQPDSEYSFLMRFTYSLLNELTGLDRAALID